METYANALQVFKGDYNNLSEQDKDYLNSFLKKECGIDSYQEAVTGRKETIANMLTYKKEMEQFENTSESSSRKRSIDSSDESSNKSRKM
jgi:hypothetical protein